MADFKKLKETFYNALKPVGKLAADVGQYFNPESNNGNNFWSSKLSTPLVKAQQAIPQPVQDFSQGFGNSTTYGMVQMKPPQMTPAYRVGQVAGIINPLNPLNKGMAALNIGGKAVGAIAPKLVGTTAGKVLGGIGSELAQTAVYTGAQALTQQAGLKDKTPITPQTFAQNLVLGAGARGLLGAAPSVVTAMTKRLPQLPKIDPSDQKVMEEFINYARLKKKGAKSLKLEEYASTIAEQYNLPMPKTITGLADVFDDTLSRIRKQEKEIADLGLPQMGIVGKGQAKTINPSASSAITEPKLAPPKAKTPPQIESPPLVPVRPQVESVTTAPSLPKKVATTLESQANLKQSKAPTAKPLTDIIRSEPIDVRQKVGVLDYIRTPDRVLQKIGLAKEAEALRKSYDNYLAQLPTEIDRITKWSQQVSPESNQRIFKWLDGQKVELSPQESKVAGEVRQYLEGWADRLGLDKNKRITNYITHIFEKDFIQKEFDPEIAKLIENRVAGSVYDPFTEQRLGKLGYVEDTWRALDAYVKRASRKVNMDPVLAQLKDKAESLETSQYDFVKTYVDRINMRPTKMENLVDNSLKQIVGYKFGQRPTALLSRAGRQAVYRGALGLNFGTALRNLTQGANTYAKLGEKYTVKGYWDILTKGAKELEEVGVLRDDLIQDRTLSAGKQVLQKLDKGLFYFFELAEKINRGSAYYGAKAKALAQGMTEEQAIEAGKKLVRDTQFTFGRIDTPVALQNDIIKLLTQFQSYTLKQGEFLGEMAKNKEWAGLIRYGLASTALVATIGELVGMEWTDMIPSFRIGAPPTLKAPYEIGKAVVGVPDKYGNVPDTQQRLENVGKSLLPYIPAGVQINKTVGGLTDVGKGYSETRKGMVRYPIEQSTGNYVRGGLFGPNNLPEAQQYYDSKAKPLSESQTTAFKQSPDKQQVYREVMAKREENKQVEEAKANLKEGSQIIGKTVVYSDNGTVKTFKVNDLPQAPTLTGQAEVDKQRQSKYQSQLTAYRNDVLKMLDLKLITPQEAETKLQQINQIKAKTKKVGTKKGKKITFKAPKAIKIKVPKLRAIKVKKPSRVKKLTLPKVARIRVKKPRKIAIRKSSR